MDSKVQKSFLSLKSPKEDGKKKTHKIHRDRGIVYMSHIPHGFYEQQLRGFLSQFGTITNLRLGRSKKTGRCKGYAFIEFKYRRVAEIVSKTMNNYLMFQKLLKCEVVPKEKVKKGIFKHKVNPKKPPQEKERFKAKKIVNKNRTEEQIYKRSKRQMKKLKLLSEKLKAAGVDCRINFELPERKKTKHPDKSEATKTMEVDDNSEDEVKLKAQKKSKKRPADTSPNKSLDDVIKSAKKPKLGSSPSKLPGQNKNTENSSISEEASPFNLSSKMSRWEKSKPLTPKSKDVKKDETPKSKDVKKDETPKSKAVKKDETPKSKNVKKDETPKSKNVKKDETPKSKNVKKDETPKSKNVKKDETPKSNRKVKKISEKPKKLNEKSPRFAGKKNKSPKM